MTDEVRLQSGTKVVDTIVSNARFYQQTIISFCLNAVIPPILESLLFVVNERLEGLKSTWILGEEGGGTLEEGIDMSTV